MRVTAHLFREILKIEKCEIEKCEIEKSEIAKRRKQMFGVQSKQYQIGKGQKLGFKKIRGITFYPTDRRT